MPFNGSGTFARSNGVNGGATTWQLDRDAGTKIVSDRHDVHDEDLASGLTQCVTKTGESTPTADLPMGGYKHTNVDDGTARSHYSSIGQLQDGAITYAGATTGTGAAFVCSVTPTITAYVTGMRILFKANRAAADNSTLNVNGVGAKQVVSLIGTNILAYSWVANQWCEVVYDSTGSGVWVLLSPALGQTPPSWSPTYGASGSMTYGTVTTDLAVYSWRAGYIDISLRAHGTIGGTPSTTVTFTLPVAAKYTHSIFAGHAVNTTALGASEVAAVFTNAAASDVVNVQLVGQANWAARSDVYIEACGSYIPDI